MTHHRLLHVLSHPLPTSQVFLISQLLIRVIGSLTLVPLITSSSRYPYTNISSHASHPISLPNGSFVPTTQRGNLHLSPNLTLMDASLFSSFNLNLLSVSKITSSWNCYITLYRRSCVFQDPSMKRTIGCGRDWDGLNYLDFTSPTTASFIIRDLWHQRLGHLSSGCHQLLSSRNKDITCSSLNNRDVCSMSKQTKTSFFLLVHVLVACLLNCFIATFGGVFANQIYLVHIIFNSCRYFY